MPPRAQPSRRKRCRGVGAPREATKRQEKLQPPAAQPQRGKPQNAGSGRLAQKGRREKKGCHAHTTHSHKQCQHVVCVCARAGRAPVRERRAGTNRAEAAEAPRPRQHRKAPRQLEAPRGSAPSALSEASTAGSRRGPKTRSGDQRSWPAPHLWGERAANARPTPPSQPQRAPRRGGETKTKASKALARACPACRPLFLLLQKRPQKRTTVHAPLK